MKVTIETKPNTNTNAVAEGFPEQVTVICEGVTPDGQPYKETILDEPTCCTGCGMSAGVQRVMEIQMQANAVGLIEFLKAQITAPVTGDEWKEGDK